MYQCQGEEFAGPGTCRCLSTSLWVWLCQRGHWYWSSLQADSVVSCPVHKSITILSLSTATPSNQATILPSRPSCSKSDIIATGPTINLLKQVDAKRLRARCNRTPQPKPCKHSTNKAWQSPKKCQAAFLTCPRMNRPAEASPRHTLQSRIQRIWCNSKVLGFVW